MQRRPTFWRSGLCIEQLETRRLLAVDLAIRVDPMVESSSPDDTVSQIVRVFNNGDTTATDAVIQLDLTGEFENPTWSRRRGRAQIVHGRQFQADDRDISGDYNNDGFIDSVSSPFIVFGGTGAGEPGRSSQVIPLIPNLWGEPPTAVNSGDFNGDGVDDVLFHTAGGYHDSTASDRGLLDVVSGAHIVFGRADLSDFPVLNAAAFGVSLGVRTGHESERSAVGMKDVNSDGIHDVLLTFDDTQLVILGGSHLQTTFYGAFSTEELNGENGYLVKRGASEQADSSEAMEGAGNILQTATIPAGQSVVFTIRGHLKQDSSGTISVSAATSSPGADPDLSDNSFNIDAPTELAVSVEHAELAVGEVASFRIDVTNEGGSRAKAVEILETISSTLIDASWSLETKHLFPDEIHGFQPSLGPGLIGFQLKTVDFIGDTLEFQVPVPTYLSNDTDMLGINFGALGDINGDGFDDFYIGRSEEERNFSRSLQIILGSADFVSRGGFETTTGTTTFRGSRRSEEYISATPLGDINGDEFDDFLLESRLSRSRDSKFQIIYGQADFAFKSTVISRDFRRRGVSIPVSRAGDLNGDGKEDLIQGASVDLGGTKVEVLQQDARLYRTGDINHDGVDDLVAVRPNSGGVRLLLGGSTLPNSWDVTLHPAIMFPTSDLRVTVVEGSHDLNGDGVDDFVSYWKGFRSDEPIRFFVLPGASDIANSDMNVIPFEFPGSHDDLNVVIGDWNGDCFSDLALSEYPTSIYFGSENFISSEPQMVIHASCRDDLTCLPVMPGVDVNQDGIEDLFIGDPAVGPYTEYGAAGAVYFILGRAAKSQSGDGSFSGGFELGPGESVALQITGVVTEQTLQQSHQVHLRSSIGQHDLNPFSTSVKLPAIDPLLGDLDQDGAVGFSDFLILSRNFGTQVASSLEGDLDDDGEVGLPDFLIFSGQFGQS